VIVAGVLTAAGLGLLHGSGPLAGPNPAAVALLTAFLVTGELRPLKWLRRQVQGGEVTVSWSFAFAILLMASPIVAVAALTGASLVGDLTNRKSFQRALFNAAQVTLSLAAGAGVLVAFGQRDALLRPDGPGPGWLVAIVLAATAIFVTNGLLTCMVIALHERLRVRPLIREGLWLNLSIDGILLALGPVLVIVADYSLLLLPLLLTIVLAVYRSAYLALARQHEASHDQLTGLPNRRFFREQVEAALAEAGHGHAGFAVMILDLDGFKEVNDKFGHHLGDDVLRQVGVRFTETSRPHDLVARLGGDEFAVLAPLEPGGAGAADIAAGVLAALAQPCVVQGLPVALAASIGVAVYPAHGEDFSTLLRHADAAMYDAKAADTAVYVFSDEAVPAAYDRLDLLAELLSAIDAGQLVVHFQPKVDMRTQLMVGVEALARWQHPKLGLVAPNDFIPLAEHTELIEPFTEFVLERSLAHIADIHRAGYPLPVAVNVSARNLHDIAFTALVQTLLDTMSLPPSALEIELTESTVMVDPARTVVVVSALRAMGVRVAIDDFGTGYSSLATLRDLPVSAVKIDKSFVSEILRDDGDAAIVQATIDLAHRLKLVTVAEGVENVDTWTRLLAFGCDAVQGYLTGRPISAGDLLAQLTEHGTRVPGLPSAQLVALR
jgi:diguanylate cyclase (GGDEF)-like protein